MKIITARAGTTANKKAQSAVLERLVNIPGFVSAKLVYTTGYYHCREIRDYYFACVFDPRIIKSANLRKYRVLSGIKTTVGAVCNKALITDVVDAVNDLAEAYELSSVAAKEQTPSKLYTPDYTEKQTKLNLIPSGKVPLTTPMHTFTEPVEPCNPLAVKLVNEWQKWLADDLLLEPHSALVHALKPHLEQDVRVAQKLKDQLLKLDVVGQGLMVQFQESALEEVDLQIDWVITTELFLRRLLEFFADNGFINYNLNMLEGYGTDPSKITEGRPMYCVVSAMVSFKCYPGNDNKPRSLLQIHPAGKSFIEMLMAKVAGANKDE